MAIKPYAESTPSQTPAGARDRRFASVTRGFHALQVRNYRLFWIGQLISQTGSWMQTTAQAWLVLQLTQSPFALGLVTTLQFLPIMLLSLIGGVITDRWPKHRLSRRQCIAGIAIIARRRVVLAPAMIAMICNDNNATAVDGKTPPLRRGVCIAPNEHQRSLSQLSSVVIANLCNRRHSS